MKRGPLLLKTFVLFLVSIYASTQCVLAYSPETNFWKERQKAVPSAQYLVPSLGTKHQALGTDSAVPSILHIQDVHLNLEAQTNISQKIYDLLRDQQIDLVALEGAFGDIDISPFKEFPDQDAVHSAAEVLLNKKKLSGPMHALLRSDAKSVPIVGVDDAVHYKANVEAYRRAAKLAPQEKEKIAAEEKALQQEKSRTFNKELLAFDADVDAYRAGTLSLGRYAERVAGPNASPALRSFLEALALENTLDWNAVEAQRNRVLTALFESAPQHDRTALAEASMAYRTGQLSQMDFYAQFLSMCQRNGINLKKFPALNSYFRYVTLTKDIHSETLFTELKNQEKLSYERLAKTDSEHALIATSNKLHLAKKLIDFALTKNEWNEYKTSSAQTNIACAAFERFYEEAEIRDHLMAENLSKAIKNHGANHVALVTGGFHSDGIRNGLSDSGFRLTAFTPKLTKIDEKESSSYLTVFAQEKTPLQKLLSGEKLFLAPEVWDVPTRTMLAEETLSQNKAGDRSVGSRTAAQFLSRLIRKSAKNDSIIKSVMVTALLTGAVWMGKEALVSTSMALLGYAFTRQKTIPAPEPHDVLNQAVQKLKEDNHSRADSIEKMVAAFEWQLRKGNTSVVFNNSNELFKVSLSADDVPQLMVNISLLSQLSSDIVHFPADRTAYMDALGVGVRSGLVAANYTYQLDNRLRALKHTSKRFASRNDTELARVILATYIDTQVGAYLRERVYLSKAGWTTDRMEKTFPRFKGYALGRFFEDKFKFTGLYERLIVAGNDPMKVLRSLFLKKNFLPLVYSQLNSTLARVVKHLFDIEEKEKRVEVVAHEITLYPGAFEFVDKPEYHNYFENPLGLLPIWEPLIKWANDHAANNTSPYSRFAPRMVAALGGLEEIVFSGFLLFAADGFLAQPSLFLIMSAFSGAIFFVLHQTKSYRWAEGLIVQGRPRLRAVAGLALFLRLSFVGLFYWLGSWPALAGIIFIHAAYNAAWAPKIPGAPLGIAAAPNSLMGGADPVILFMRETVNELAVESPEYADELKKMWKEFERREKTAPDEHYFEHESEFTGTLRDEHGDLFLTFNDYLMRRLLKEANKDVSGTYRKTLKTIVKGHLVKEVFVARHYGPLLKTVDALMKDPTQTDVPKTYFASVVTLDAHAFLVQDAYYNSAGLDAMEMQHLSDDSPYPIFKNLLFATAFGRLFLTGAMIEGHVPLRAAKEALLMAKYIPAFEALPGNLNPMLASLLRDAVKDDEMLIINSYPVPTIEFLLSVADDPRYVKLPALEQQESEKRIIQYLVHLVLGSAQSLTQYLDYSQYEQLQKMIYELRDNHAQSPASVSLPAKSPTLMLVEPDAAGTPALSINFDLFGQLMLELSENRKEISNTLNALLLANFIEMTHYYVHGDYIRRVFFHTNKFTHIADKTGRHALETARKVIAMRTHIQAQGFISKKKFFDSIGWTLQRNSQAQARLGDTLYKRLLSGLHIFLTELPTVGIPDAVSLIAAQKMSFSYQLNYLLTLPEGHHGRQLIETILDDEMKHGRARWEGKKLRISPDAFAFLHEPFYYEDDSKPGQPLGLLPHWPASWMNGAMVGVLGAAEELFFSGILVAGGTWLLSTYLHVLPENAFTFLSVASGLVFMWLHFGESTRWKNGQLVRGPPNEHAAFLLSASLRILFAVFYFHTSPLIATALIALVHGPLYNALVTRYLTDAPLGTINTNGPSRVVEHIMKLAHSLDAVERNEHAPDVRSMINDFNRRRQTNPSSAEFTDPIQLMTHELDQDGVAHLKINGPLIEKLLDEQDDSHELHAFHTNLANRYLEACLIEQAFYIQHNAELRFMRHEIHRFTNAGKTAASDPEDAKRLVARQIDLEGRALIEKELYLETAGWASTAWALLTYFQHTTLGRVIQHVIEEHDTYHKLTLKHNEYDAAQTTVLKYRYLRPIKSGRSTPFDTIVASLGNRESDFPFLHERSYYSFPRAIYLNLASVWKPLIRWANTTASEGKHWASRFAPHAVASLGGLEEIFFSGVIVGGGVWLTQQFLGITGGDIFMLWSTISVVAYAASHRQPYRWVEGSIVRTRHWSESIVYTGVLFRFIFADLYYSAGVVGAVGLMIILHGVVYNAILVPLLARLFPRSPLRLGIAANGGGGLFYPDEAPNPDKIPAIKILRRAVRELKEETHENADTVEAMWKDFEARLLIPKNKKHIIIPAGGEIMEVAEDPQGRIFLRVNISDINELVRDQEFFGDGTQDYIDFVKDCLKMLLLEQSFYVEHSQETVEINKEISAFGDETMFDQTRRLSAHDLFARQVALEAGALARGMGYLDTKGWDADLFNTLQLLLGDRLLGELIGYTMELYLGRDFARERYNDTLDATKETVLYAYINAAYFSDDLIENISPLNKLIRFVTDIEIENKFVTIQHDAFEFTDRAFAYVFETDTTGDEPGSQSFFGFLPLLGALNPHAPALLSLPGMLLVVFVVANIFMMRHNHPRKTAVAAPRKEDYRVTIAKDIAHMAAIAAARPDRKVSNIVDEFFKGAPLRLGLDSPTTDEPNWDTLFRLPGFSQILKAELENAHVELTPGRAYLLLSKLLGRSEKYRSDDTSGQNFVYVLQNFNNTGELENIAKQLRPNAHLTVLIDVTEDNSAIKEKLAPLVAKNMVQFHDTLPLAFINGHFLELEMLKRNLPKQAKDNWNNLIVLCPTGLVPNAARLSESDLDTLRVQFVKEFLAGHVALCIADQLLLKNLAALLVTRRQA